MKEIEIKHLEVGKKIGSFVYHKSGELLHKPDEELTLEHLMLLEECGIDRVIFLDANEDAQILKNKVQKKIIKLEQLKVGDTLPVTLYDHDNNIVAQDGAVVKEDFIERLHTNNVTELYYLRDAQELENFQYNKYISLLESDMFASLGSVMVLEHPLERERKALEQFKRKDEELRERERYEFSNVRIDPARLISNPAQEINTTGLKNAMKTGAEMRIVPTAPALEKVVKRIVYERDDEVKKSYQSSYEKWIKELIGIFTRLKSNQQVPYKEIDSLAKVIITSFALDGFYFLNLANLRNSNDAGEYIPSHCLNVACIATGMCAMLGFSAIQTIEVIIGALLHDIGHMMTYQPLLLKGSLDTSEQQKFDEHAPLGVAMLKNITMVPKSAPFIVYQHHERLDGSGRLLHCLDATIHDYAKLIAVADEYELQSRKKNPFTAINTILGFAKDKKLDMSCVRSLLITLSLYPLGSIVIISGNKVCKVVGTNVQQFKAPIVRTIFFIRNNQLEAIPNKELIDLSTAKGIIVERNITHPVLNKKIGIGF
jgi:putative nucleotidyltransferase with HDIG domain